MLLLLLHRTTELDNNPIDLTEDNCSPCSSDNEVYSRVSKVKIQTPAFELINISQYLPY